MGAGDVRERATQMKWPVSLCLLTHNEERRLEGFFSHVRPLVSEIIVFDSGSNDRSVEIARKHAEVMIVQPLKDFSSQRNDAAARASHRWVLHLDADESMTPELVAAITALFDGGAIERYAAYCFPRRTFDEEGKLRKIVQSYPGFLYRLYDRERCRWIRPVHETLEIQGPKRFIPHHIVHYPDYARVPDKLSLYTRLTSLPVPPGRPTTARAVCSNFLFHARALFLDLGMWKRPSDIAFACHWLLHQALVRCRRSR